MRALLDGIDDPDLRAFYEARDYRPLWVRGERLRPQAGEVVRLIAESRADGFDPEHYDLPALNAALAAARTGEPAALARAEIALSKALADYIHDLRTPASGAELVYVHRQVAPAPATRLSVLDSVARAPSLQGRLATIRAMNPLYEELRAGLTAYRARWSALPQDRVSAQNEAALRRRLGAQAGSLEEALREFQAAHGLSATGVADAVTIAALNRGADHYEKIILANLERARALPVDPGERYVLVDTAGQTLWLYENGFPVDSMKVIVGKERHPTPAMAGAIRYAVYNPYWNMPQDLIRWDVARAVLRKGPAALDERRLEVLSDWTPNARVLEPAEVDWRAVVNGEPLRVRQKPGPDNTMGLVKFMLPNRLGIYLHDTPDKWAFAGSERRMSSGCVRLEDAERLASWLFKGRSPNPRGVEERVNLPEPVPVYITYLTAAPGPSGIVFQPDAYARDEVVLTALDSRGG